MRLPLRSSRWLLLLISLLVLPLSCHRPEPSIANYRTALNRATANNLYTRRDAARMGALEGWHILGEEFEVVVYRHRSSDAARAWAKRHGSLHNGPLTLTVFKDVNQIAGSIFMRM